jgi:hypothetical protein
MHAAILMRRLSRDLYIWMRHQDQLIKQIGAHISLGIPWFSKQIKHEAVVMSVSFSLLISIKINCIKYYLRCKKRV